MHILWYRKLYVGENADRHIRKIKWKLRHGVGTLRVYLLTMPSNSRNSLDIINAAYLQQPYYKRQQMKVIGIAMSYEEALQVLQQIVTEVYQETHQMDIKGYIESKQGNWQV